jgi:hypothetical protein
VRIVRRIERGRELLLRRLSLEAPELPPAVRDDIRRVFGAELDAAGVVERILRAVRAEAMRRPPLQSRDRPAAGWHAARSHEGGSRARLLLGRAAPSTPEASGRPYPEFHKRQLEHSHGASSTMASARSSAPSNAPACTCPARRSSTRRPCLCLPSRRGGWRLELIMATLRRPMASCRPSSWSPQISPASTASSAPAASGHRRHGLRH